MKKIALFSLLSLIGFLSTTSIAFAQNGNSIVLGVSLDDGSQQFQFPCIANSNVVFCDNSPNIDSTCRNTMKYQQAGYRSISISCTTSDGQTVKLAQTRGDLIEDQTQDAFGYVPTQLTPEGREILSNLLN